MCPLSTGLSLNSQTSDGLQQSRLTWLHVVTLNQFRLLTSTDMQSIKDAIFLFFHITLPFIQKKNQKKKKHWRCLHHRQESSIFCFKQFFHEQNEPHAHPSPGANSSIHSILYIPIVPVQSLCILHHYQSSINSFKIHTMLFPL